MGSVLSVGLEPDLPNTSCITVQSDRTPKTRVNRGHKNTDPKSENDSREYADTDSRDDSGTSQDETKVGRRTRRGLTLSAGLDERG